MKARDLQLGDVIRVCSFEGEYAHATVHQITAQSVHLVRPYIHTEDFSYTGGVLWYVGIETFTVTMSCEVILLRRKEGLK